MTRRQGKSEPKAMIVLEGLKVRLGTWRCHNQRLIHLLTGECKLKTVIGDLTVELIKTTRWRMKHGAPA